MVALTDGAPVIERMRAYMDSVGIAAKGPLGVVTRIKEKTRLEDDRELVGMATTDDMDLEEEVVLPGGADLTYVSANKSLFMDHRYDGMNKIGVIRNSTRAKSPTGADGWLSRVHLHNSKNPLVEHVLACAADPDGAPGFSIGFEALDYGRLTADEQARYPRAKSIVRRWRWIELSCTFMPCNVACQTRAMTTDTSRVAKARAILTKSCAPAYVFELLNLDLPMLEIPAPMLEVA